MSGLEIRWPDAMGERVHAARGRLDVAREALADWALEDRLAAVARVLEDWTGADSVWRRELAVSFAEASPFDPATVTEGLDSALRAWEPKRLIASVRRELSPVLDDDSLELAPFEWTAVLAGGALPMPTLLSSLLPLIVGSPVLLRESSKDHVTGALLARSLEARAPRLARAFEPIAFPADDDIALSAVLEAPCVVATGTDETMTRISNRLRADQRFVAYGHRFSIGIVGAEHPIDIPAIARGFALDVARWDQSGCLSPVVVYLVGLGASVAKDLARACAEALDALSEEMPRGQVSTAASTAIATERAEARMRSAAGAGMLFDGRDNTVVLEADARPRPAPLHRFLRLMPVDSLETLESALSPFRGHLSNAAVAGLSPRSSRRLDRLMRLIGVSRVTFPGRLQTPPVDWPHDGLPLTVPISRFVQAD